MRDQCTPCFAPERTPVGARQAGVHVRPQTLRCAPLSSNPASQPQRYAHLYTPVHHMPRQLQVGVVWLVGSLTSPPHAGVSQGRIRSNDCTCCHAKIEIADQTRYQTQTRYTDTLPTSPRAEPATPGAWQGRQQSTNFEVPGMTRPEKRSAGKAGIEPRSAAL